MPTERNALCQLASPGPSLETEEEEDEDFVADNEQEEGEDVSSSSSGSDSDAEDGEGQAEGQTSLAPEVAQEILQAVAEIQRQYHDDIEFEEEILSDSDLSREFPEEDDRYALDALTDEEAGSGGRRAVRGRSGATSTRRAAQAQQQRGKRALPARDAGASAAAGKDSKRQRGAADEAADVRAMPPPPPRLPAVPATSAAPSAASQPRQQQQQQQPDAFTISAAGPAATQAAVGSPAHPGAAQPSATTTTVTTGAAQGSSGGPGPTSPAPGSLHAFGAVLAPLDAPGTGCTTAATAPIACRTRARHDLADISIEELERMLQVDDELEGLGGLDDEAEYQRFLDGLRSVPGVGLGESGSAGAGGLPAGGALVFDSEKEEDSDDEDFVVELERMLQEWEEEEERDALAWGTRGSGRRQRDKEQEPRVRPRRGGPSAWTRARGAADGAGALESALALQERRLRPLAPSAAAPALVPRLPPQLQQQAAACNGGMPGLAAVTEAAVMLQPAVPAEVPGAKEGRAPVRWQAPLPAAVRKYLASNAPAAAVTATQAVAPRTLPPVGAPEQGTVLEPGAFQPQQYRMLYRLMSQHAQLIQQVYVMAVGTGDPAHAAAAVRSRELLEQLQGFVQQQVEARQAAGVAAYNPVALGLQPDPKNKQVARVERLRLQLAQELEGRGSEEEEEEDEAEEGQAGNTAAVKTRARRRSKAAEWGPVYLDNVYSVADVAPMRKVGKLLEELPLPRPANAAAAGAPAGASQGGQAGARTQRSVDGDDAAAVGSDEEELPRGPQSRKRVRIRGRARKQNRLWRNLSDESALAVAPLLSTYDPALSPAPPHSRAAAQHLFSPNEDEMLAFGIRRYGYDWARIKAELLPPRTEKQLFHRKKNRSTGSAPDSSIKRAVAVINGPLQPDEVEVLQKAVHYYGRQSHRWEIICQNHLPHRQPAVLWQLWEKHQRQQGQKGKDSGGPGAAQQQAHAIQPAFMAEGPAPGQQPGQGQQQEQALHQQHRLLAVWQQQQQAVQQVMYAQPPANGAMAAATAAGMPLRMLPPGMLPPMVPCMQQQPLQQQQPAASPAKQGQQAKKRGGGSSAAGGSRHKRGKEAAEGTPAEAAAAAATVWPSASPQRQQEQPPEREVQQQQQPQLHDGLPSPAHRSLHTELQRLHTDTLNAASLPGWAPEAVAAAAVGAAAAAVAAHTAQAMAMHQQQQAVAPAGVAAETSPQPSIMTRSRSRQQPQQQSLPLPAQQQQLEQQPHSSWRQAEHPFDFEALPDSDDEQDQDAAGVTTAAELTGMDMVAVVAAAAAEAADAAAQARASALGARRQRGASRRKPQKAGSTVTAATEAAAPAQTAAGSRGRMRAYPTCSQGTAAAALPPQSAATTAVAGSTGDRLRTSSRAASQQQQRAEAVTPARTRHAAAAAGEDGTGTPATGGTPTAPPSRLPTGCSLHQVQAGKAAARPDLPGLGAGHVPSPGATFEQEQLSDSESESLAGRGVAASALEDGCVEQALPAPVAQEDGAPCADQWQHQAPERQAEQVEQYLLPAAVAPAAPVAAGAAQPASAEQLQVQQEVQQRWLSEEDRLLLKTFIAANGRLAPWQLTELTAKVGGTRPEAAVLARCEKLMTRFLDRQRQKQQQAAGGSSDTAIRAPGQQ